MQVCWDENPDKRSYFREITNQLAPFLAKETL